MPHQSIIPDLKVNLITNGNIITCSKYNCIQKLVDEYVIKYKLIYPNFFITYLDVDIIDNNNYYIDELTTKFSYIKEIIQFSQLTNGEKMYISKEKIQILKLKDFFEEVKHRPIEENEMNISIFGEKYRSLKNNFYDCILNIEKK